MLFESSCCHVKAWLGLENLSRWLTHVTTKLVLAVGRRLSSSWMSICRAAWVSFSVWQLAFPDDPRKQKVKAPVHLMTWPQKLHFIISVISCWLHRLVSFSTVVKNLPASEGDAGDLGSISGSGRSPGGGDGNPLQCSCLENSMDRGACGLWSVGSQRVGHDWRTEHRHLCKGTTERCGYQLARIIGGSL